ncbi:MAG: hypothetical protein FWB96_04255 [Defluviitaleaceae bacterium]|nr:hypothetical protein [Defluviitaleaceae bacterium]
MNRLKRNISLYMAVIMVLSLFSPFATPIVVRAELPVLPGGIGTGVEGTAFGGELRAAFNAMLVPASGRPALHGRPGEAADGSVLLNWGVSVDPLGGTGAFMDVLRFFDSEGRRHELTVMQLNALDGVGLKVNYDIYFPRVNDAGEVIGYMHISDPLRGASAEVGGFQIWVPGFDDFESAFQFLVTNDRNYPIRDTIYGTHLNRVNDRMRFADTEGLPAARPYTPVRANYLTFAGVDTGNFNFGVVNREDNPEYFDPDRDPDEEVERYIYRHLAGPFPTPHYNALSPSFNIADGHGYSFRFGGRSLHFRWENGQFLFFIENFLEAGNIYDFVLERYLTANVNAYVIGTASPRPNYLTTANTVTRTTRGTVYMLTGVDRDHLNAIPFAANRGIPGDTPNTRAPRLTGYDAPGALINAPEFDGTRLDMRAHPPIAEPAEQDLGLDIRFNLPAFFDEVRGEFAYQITDPGNTHAISRQLGVALLVDVGMGETPEDFAVSFPLTGMPLYPANWGDATLQSRSVFLGLTREYEKQLNNVSLLHRTGEQYADRVRIMVGGLSSSIAYEWVRLSITPIPTNHPDTGLPVPMPTNFLVGGGRVGYPQDPFYTFLNFRFDTLLGRPVIIAEPFNRRVSHLPGFQVRTGYYQLVSDFPTPGGWAPTRVDETTTEIFFNLPDFVEAYRGFFITKSIHPPHISPPPDIMFSQDVWWTPSRIPTIDIPDRFSISNVLHRPMRGDEHAGYLSYTAQWNIASHRNIMALLGYPTDEFGSADNVIRATYVLGLSTSPETEAMIPGADRIHREYITVAMEIRRTPGGETATDLQIRYAPTATTDNVADVSDFIPSPPHILPPIPPRFLGSATLPPTVFPITNRYYEDGWVQLEYRPDPSAGENMVFASIDILTNSVRNFRYPPPPQNLRRDFHFPGIYFMNVRLDSWGIVGEVAAEAFSDTIALSDDSPFLQLSSVVVGDPIDRGGESPWSLFDYIVVDDFGRLDPPPPSSMSVVARPRFEGEPPRLEAPVQPYLDVSYAIPANALLTYLNTLYPMETQITSNLYIGLFEEAIMENYFPYSTGATPVRRPVHPDYREELATYNVHFDDERLGANFYENRTELDLTDFQSVLIGADGGTGVLRIEGIPLIHHSAITTTPAGLVFPAGGIVNYASEGSNLTQEEAFAETFRILNNPSDFPIHLRLRNVEENTAFFLFADLEIEKWVDEADGTFVLREDNPPHNPNPAVSHLTGVVTDTTIGTPQEPGPGEIAPPAPDNIGVRYIEQMGATVYWDPINLTPAEIEEGTISIEWEIIRIQDGSRLTDLQMNDRNPNFATVFQNLTQAPRRKGWITAVDSLTVVSITPPALTISEPRFIPNPNECPEEEFEYNRRIVELRDKTLHPNSLYFFYVRTVRIEEAWNDQLNDYVLIRSVSSWVEVPVTTLPIDPPLNLRQENPFDRAGFDGQTMALVSWRHPQMDYILELMGDAFAFEFQIREGEGGWRDHFVVPYNMMVEARLDPHDPLRIQFLVTGLEHSSIYQMRVRLHDRTANDRSIWSNVITILTEVDPIEDGWARDRDDWLGYLRRRLEELLRMPFWTAQRTPTSSILVFRPAEVFDGHMLSTPGTAIPLYNTGADNIIYYLPLSNVLTANENQRGFSTTFPEMEFLFAPSFLHDAHNQALIDTIRAIDARGSELTDSFVRMEINRSPLEQIFNVPAISPRTNLSMSVVATNNSVRNIRTWDQTMSTRAERIVERWLDDPVIGEGVVEMLKADYSNEAISDHIYHIIDRVEAEIIREAAAFMTTAQNGILTNEHFPIREFNAPMHVVARNVNQNTFVSGNRWVNERWQAETLVEHHNGRAFIARAPGEFAFAGRVVDIPGIETVPRGDAVTQIVARHGLEDYLGIHTDLMANANRQMVVGSVARAAGVPQGADVFAWANANLNVNMSSRNSTGLVSNQEAIAIVMALYEHRTNTRINTIRINNMARTANMTLDPRYAQAVRAAFELGLVTDDTLNPAGSMTTGALMDMLALLNARVRV